LTSHPSIWKVIYSGCSTDKERGETKSGHDDPRRGYTDPGLWLVVWPGRPGEAFNEGVLCWDRGQEAEEGGGRRPKAGRGQGSDQTVRVTRVLSWNPERTSQYGAFCKL